MKTAYLDRDVAEKIYELVGEHETENEYRHLTFDIYQLIRRKKKYTGISLGCFPAPDFSETIRILPNIGGKKGWERDEVTNKISMRRVSHILAEIYMLAPTAEEGMKNVSDYLRRIIL